MTSKFAVYAFPLALLLCAGDAAAVTAEKAERAAPDRVVVTWTDSDPVDVFVADGPEVGISAARLVSDDNRSGRFEFAADPAKRPYILLRDGGDGRVTRTAERALPLQQGSNFRDLGGYPGAGGKHVRWGRIFRSGATPLLTDADVMMIKALGLAEMVDLRSSEERVLAPSRVQGVPYTAVGYSMSGVMGERPAAIGEDRMGDIYRRFPTLLAPQLRILFADLLAGEGPVAYNCSAGQDRTGFATAMVLSALGVPRETIIADYHLSTTYRHPEFEMPKLDAATQAANPVAAMFGRYQQDPRYSKPRPLMDGEKRAYLEFALAEVEGRWGSVEAYLDKELGVDAADIARLRAMYLE
jgi:protein-tyrosine phosphatase